MTTWIILSIEKGLGVATTGRNCRIVCKLLEMDGKALFDYLNWMNPVDSPHTMCGDKNLENVRQCVEDVLKEGVPGDLIETGVWKGGMTILMRGILKAHDCRDQRW